MQDGKFLHFLKSFPAWLVLTGLIVFILVLRKLAADPFLDRIADTLVGGLLLVLTGRVFPPTQPLQQSNVENVEKMTVNAPGEPLNNLTEGEINSAVEKIEER